jgi:hypothetical protein
MSNILKVYVVDPTGEFESIKDKVNANISQFNVRIETNSSGNLKY